MTMIVLIFMRLFQASLVLAAASSIFKLLLDSCGLGGLRCCKSDLGNGWPAGMRRMPHHLGYLAV